MAWVTAMAHRCLHLTYTIPKRRLFFMMRINQSTEGGTRSRWHLSFCLSIIYTCSTLSVWPDWGSNSHSTYICTAPQYREQDCFTSGAICTFGLSRRRSICHQLGNRRHPRAETIKRCLESPGNLLAVLPQASWWGTTCAALTRRRADQPILSMGLISVRRCGDSTAACWQRHMCVDAGKQTGDCLYEVC